MSATIQLRRDTAANWTAVNPVLHPGELGLESDTSKLKVGDGTTAWTSLAYFAGGGGGAVSSVFGRTGAVVAQAGDYTAAQVGALSNSTPVTIAEGGTGQATQQAAIDALTGTQSAGKYLRSDGTHATLQVIQEGDLPAGVGDQAWQFRPESYGAKGDGKIINDATVAGGALTTLTSASANFTSSDTGKHIMLNGGQGNNAQPLITTITFVNSTTVTLGVASSGALTNASAIYGSDDTSAINSCLTAAGSFATGAFGNYHAQVLLGNKFYCLTTPPPVASGIGGSTTCQLQIPSPNANGTTQKLVIDILGAGSADANMYFDSAVPNIQGSALVSMCIPAYSPGTNPYPSVIGYQYADTGGLTGGFANTKVFVDGVTVVIPFLGPQGAYDFRFLSGAGIGSASAMAFSAVAGSYSNLPSLNGLGGQQGGSSVGLFMPLTGNNDDCQIDSFAVEGFTYGINVTEHIAAKRLDAIYCIVGIQCVGGGAHGNWVGYFSAEVCVTAVQYTGTSAFPLVISYMDTEQISTWHVQDTQNALYGKVIVHTNSGSPPAVQGGSHMSITYDLYGPAEVPKVAQLTDGATISLQADLGNVFTVTLGGNRTLANPTNPQDGQVIHVRVTQDGTGSRTLAYDTEYDFGAGSSPTLSTAAGKVDILGFEYVASLSKWCYLGSGLGF